MNLTIKDIAQLAKVSHATVSRVLNGSSMVKPATRERVMAVINECGFTPSVSARALNSGKNYNIGMLLLYDVFQSQVPTDSFAAILKGVSESLIEAGYMMSVFFETEAEEKNQLTNNALMNRNLDGIIALGVETNARLAFRISGIRLPTVLLNHRYDGLNISSVTTDDERGAREAVEYLLSLGHRQIAFLEGNPSQEMSNARRRGYEGALRDNALSPNPALMRRGWYDKDRAYHATLELISSGVPFTALFASNDIMALGALRALNESGLSVPGDISLVGFDDAQFASLVTPSLTTVRRPRASMGLEAAKLMLQRLKDGDGTAKNIVLADRLVKRASTRAL